MASSLSYSLLYAGTPFITDMARSFPTEGPAPATPLLDLIDEANRLLPTSFLQDFAPPVAYPGRNLTGIAAHNAVDKQPDPHTVAVGRWFYPTTASRWSVFRMLATSSMAAEMLGDTGGDTQQTFTMKCVPIDPADRLASVYTVSTSMYMLPPRPIAETGGSIDGLYLVTLVDSRWYLQGTPVTLHPDASSTWTTLLASVATATGLTISFQSTPLAAYGTPEPDSPLWCNAENAAILLDAIAFNTGRVVCRLMNGTFILRTPVESQAIVDVNRPSDTAVVRMAGGNLFYNSGGNLPVGDLTAAKNAVIPTSVTTTFPKYIASGDPVPHFLNSRQAGQQPTSWRNQSYPDTYSVTIGIASGGTLVNTGYTGTSTQVLHDTAKALYSSETASTGTPGNDTALTTLAMQLAKDYYDGQVAYALDEVYPGTVNWTPEGIHDIVWTWSERSKQASTRVMRSPWNQVVTEFQHSLGAVGGGAGLPVSQTWQDSVSGVLTPDAGLTVDLTSGDFTATFDAVSYLPSQNRWKGRIEDETILFEGTSGGTTVGIVRRGIDGTSQVAHAAGFLVSGLVPNTTYAVNLVKFEKGQYVYPQEMSSGGVNSVHVIPQTQNILVQSASGISINGIPHYSGLVTVYNTQAVSGSQFVSHETCWVTERNQSTITSGWYYDGAFVGWGSSGGRPVYAVNQAIGSGGGPTPSTTTSLISGTLAAGTYVDHQLPNANIYRLLPTGPVILPSLIWAAAASGFQVIEVYNAASAPSAGQAPNTITYTNEDTAGTAKYRITTVDAKPINQQPGETVQFKYADRWHPAEREPDPPYTSMSPGGGGGSPYTVGANLIGRSGVDTSAIGNTHIGIFSGAISHANLTSGGILSGGIRSGAVTGHAFGGEWVIASGTIAGTNLGSGSVMSGHVNSGAVQGHAVAGTWNIVSGSIGAHDFSSGAVLSGHVGSGAIQGHINGGTFNIVSGTIGGGDIASGGVFSGHIATPAVFSGNIGSGAIGATHMSQGTFTAGTAITVSHTPTTVTIGGNYTAGTGLTLSTAQFSLTAPVIVALGGTNSTAALSNSRLMWSTAGTIVEATALTNGQLFIGSTGAAPSPATITAGTNISVTNGAGSITIAATAGAGSPLTTKGDIYTYTSVNARLAVGTNNYVLAADSAESTGLKWATLTSLGAAGGDINYFKQVGTTPEQWYPAGLIHATGAAAYIATDTIDHVEILFALPFIAPRGGTIDRIAFRTADGFANANATCGIYSSTSTTNLYPDALIVTGDDEDLSTAGLKDTTINITLTAGVLYWFVLVQDSSSAFIQYYAINGDTYAPLGIDASLGGGASPIAGAGIGWYKAFSYAALPATFPAGGSVMYNNTSPVFKPIIAVRFSA